MPVKASGMALVGVLAVAGLAAGCSGASSTTAAERSICTTVKGWVNTPPTTTTTTPPNFIGQRVSARVLLLPDGFVAQLDHSTDAVFRSVAASISAGRASGWLNRLNAECSTLGV